MKRFIIIITLITFTFNGFGQVDTAKQKNQIIRLRCCGIPDSTKQALTLINGKSYEMKYLSGLNIKIIKEINVYKGKDAIKKYGSKAEYGVIVITTKKGAKWLNVKDILTKNKIDKENLKLPIIYNGNLMQVPYVLTKKGTSYNAVLLSAVDYQLKDKKINGKYLLISETN